MNSDRCAPLSPPSAAWTADSLLRMAVAAGAVVTCCLLVGLGAQVRVLVPGTDVPATLQLLAVLLTGLMLPPSSAAAAMLLYLTCGAAGLPMFVPGSGGLAGPTGGYLIGFVPAACLVSLASGAAAAGFVRRARAAALGGMVVLGFGVGWRAAFAYLAGLRDGSLPHAVATGLAPFAMKTVVEVLLAAMLVTAHARRSR